MKRVQEQGEAVVIDACVLAVFAVADLLLLIAELTPLFTPRWTDNLLEEMHRAHRKFGWGASVAATFRACLNPAFPEAKIADYEQLMEQCANDSGDRHVLAAAIKGQVGRILTFNLGDFRKEALTPWGIEAVHPDDFLSELYAKDRSAVRKALIAQADKQRSTVSERLTYMQRHVPEFAARVLIELG